MLATPVLVPIVGCAKQPSFPVSYMSYKGKAEFRRSRVLHAQATDGLVGCEDRRLAAGATRPRSGKLVRLLDELDDTGGGKRRN